MCVDIYNCITVPILAETCCVSATNGNVFKGAYKKQSIKANWKSKPIHQIAYQKLNVSNYTDVDTEVKYEKFKYFTFFVLCYSGRLLIILGVIKEKTYY